MAGGIPPTQFNNVERFAQLYRERSIQLEQ